MITKRGFKPGARIARHKREEPEHSLQKQVITLLRFNAYPGVVFFHVPNEGKRGIKARARLKQEGVLAGVSDIVLFIPPQGRAHCLELKVKPNTPTDAQVAFGDAVAAAGGRFAVAYSLSEARIWLESWGAIRQLAARPAIQVAREAA